MNTFIINLPECTERRMVMQSQLEKTHLSYEIINAVRGTGLSNKEIQSLVYDYPNCKLTKGEIGCALSHLSVYKIMIEKNISHALVLEDDTIIPVDIADTLNKIKKIDNQKKANVYLLSRVHSYIENKKLKSNIYSAYNALGTHAYVINRKAAENMILAQTPIFYEADMWWYFNLFKYINLYCYIPHVIALNEQSNNDSSLESERSQLAIDRASYRRKIRNKKANYQYLRVKNLLLKKYFFKIKPGK
ncbi:glycosyltransferase family 25 protein [Providencia stuartii]|uniref:glycosyltransferase family 25 protein n=1 Tax=Providencia sp. 2023EL-00965 TaxID=3084975 RepID=UPI0027FD14BB|nr:glycosyltransferase family 25 protein [Providencia sp. 2023EL-00965]ELR5301596.1 glycosyltransferase family 25 protein [Providencia stuartii]MDW7590064.1 glycosyltransferase family 25 protein [Providencia sp. 2023EL-00965]